MLELMKKFRVKLQVIVFQYFVKRTQFVEHCYAWQRIELEKYLHNFNDITLCSTI
jgi:hypothetical protein